MRMGEQNEFGQGPGVDLTQGGTFTLSTEYTRDRSDGERQFEIAPTGTNQIFARASGWRCPNAAVSTAGGWLRFG